jgi:hypothetical protein
VTGRFQHGRQDRSGPRAEIESAAAESQARFKRTGEAEEKPPVARVVRTVLVPVVFGLFGWRCQMVNRRHEDQAANPAAPIWPLLVLVEIRALPAVAERAGLAAVGWWHNGVPDRGSPPNPVHS